MDCLILLRHDDPPIGWSWSDRLATRAAQEVSGQRDRQLSSDGRDRVLDVPLGSDRRRLGVVDGWKVEVFRGAGALRGEWPLVRGSGSRKRRCTAWRGDGNLASLALRNARGRVRSSVPRSRARCASAIWPCRREPRWAHLRARSKASISSALCRLSAIRREAIRADGASKVSSLARLAVSARRRSARTKFRWSPRARTRCAKPVGQASSPASWPKRAHGRHRAARATACVRVRSRVLAAAVPPQEARR